MISEQTGDGRDKHNCQYRSYHRADRVPSPARRVGLGEGVHDVIEREGDCVESADDCRGEKDDKGAVVAAADALGGGLVSWGLAGSTGLEALQGYTHC